MWSGDDVIVECKHRHWIRKNPELVERILTRLPQFGFLIVLLTEEHLRGGYEQNVRMLAPPIGRPVSDLSRIIQFCDQPRPFGEVRSRLSVANSDVLGAIAQGHLSCNLRLNRITPGTVVQAALNPSYLWVPNLDE